MRRVRWAGLVLKVGHGGEEELPRVKLGRGAVGEWVAVGFPLEVEAGKDAQMMRVGEEDHGAAAALAGALAAAAGLSSAVAALAGVYLDAVLVGREDRVVAVVAVGAPFAEAVRVSDRMLAV